MSNASQQIRNYITHLQNKLERNGFKNGVYDPPKEENSQDKKTENNSKTSRKTLFGL